MFKDFQYKLLPELEEKCKGPPYITVTLNEDVFHEGMLCFVSSIYSEIYRLPLWIASC